MIQIPTDKKVIVDQYSQADQPGKKMLHKIFGEKFFLPIFDRIKGWEDVAAELGLDPVLSLPFANPANDRQAASNSGYILDCTAEVLADGVLLDWANPNQRKWIPRFYDYKPGAGFRFFGSNGAWTYSGAIGGARLFLPTEELSDYFGQQFLPHWNIFLKPIQ